jgi:hypothetical protein
MRHESRRPENFRPRRGESPRRPSPRPVPIGSRDSLVIAAGPAVLLVLLLITATIGALVDGQPG